MRLIADLRMVRHSGIGRYLRNIMPVMLPLLEMSSIRILSRRAILHEEPWLLDPRIEFIEAPAPIYSVQELMSGLSGAWRPGARITDILWVPHYNAPLFAPCPLVVTLHDIAPIAVPSILDGSLKRRYARLLIERAVQQAAAILTVSDFTRRELIERLTVPPEKITVTPLGLESTWLAHAEGSVPATAPAPHAEADGRPFLLFVGNVKPNKNLGLLLQAFSDVMDRLPHRLVIVGQKDGLGTGDDAVLQRARQLGDRARFAGQVSDAALRSLYAGAAAFVMPSLYEGFGLPLLEAMSVGCPVLCSTAASLPEVGGDAALYFAPDDPRQLAACLLRVQDQGLMDDLRAHGRQRLSHFSFAQCAVQTAAVLNRVAARSGQKGQP